MENPTRARELEIRPADGEVLVHDPVHDKVHVLNRTAGQILELCDGTLSAAQIAASLSAASRAELQTVSEDVDAILAEFRSLQLLQGNKTFD